MKALSQRIGQAALLAGGMVIWLAGCHHRDAGLYYSPPPPPEVLGTKVDELMWRQEENAEASKYVIYQHEFELNERLGVEPNGYRLNAYGEDHVKRIAQMLRQGVEYPVVVERSQTTPKPGTQYKYPIHFNPELDLQRRELVVMALSAMGIADADERVVVAPAFAQYYTEAEAERAYFRGLSGRGGFGGGGFGGGGFGGGGFGGGF